MFSGVLHYMLYTPKHFGSRWHSLHCALRLLSDVSNLFFRTVYGSNLLCFIGWQCVSGFFRHGHFMKHPVHFASVSCIGAVSSDEMRRTIRAPRGLIGPSANFYLIFGYPLHRHIFVEITLFLTDVDTNFTLDTHCLAVSSRFLWVQVLTFRQVDTPSLASPADSDG